MSDQKIECYIIPSVPMPLILPVECVAEIVPKPAVDALNDATSSWMKGHVSWRGQRLPVLSFSSLQDASIDESRKKKPHVVVLNPIPHSARKVYSGLLCFGDIQQVEVDPTLAFSQLDEEIDLQYIDGIVSIAKTNMIIPKLPALGVAFSYF